MNLTTDHMIMTIQFFCIFALMRKLCWSNSYQGNYLKDFCNKKKCEILPWSKKLSQKLWGKENLITGTCQKECTFWSSRRTIKVPTQGWRSFLFLLKSFFGVVRCRLTFWWKNSGSFLLWNWTSKSKTQMVVKFLTFSALRPSEET